MTQNGTALKVEFDSQEERLNNRSLDLLERVIRTEEGQYRLAEQIKLQSRQIERYFEQNDKQFELLRADIDKRFAHNEQQHSLIREQMEKGFTQVDKRFERVNRSLRWGFGIIIGAFAGLYGIIVAGFFNIFFNLP